MSDANMDNKKRTITVIAATIFVILVIAVILISAIVLKKNRETCQLTYKAPVVNIADQVPVASRNKRALVRFAGHLRLWNADPLVRPNPNRYLALKLKQVQYEQQYYSTFHLTLEADCANVDFEVNRSEDTEMFHVKTITIESKTAHTNFTKCHIPTSSINFPTDHYWYCPSYRNFYCPGTDINPNPNVETPRVELAFNVLDIEIDGNPESISRGYFEKEGTSCEVE